MEVPLPMMALLVEVELGKDPTEMTRGTASQMWGLRQWYSRGKTRSPGLA